MQFATFGYTNAYGVYNDFYVREYLSPKYSSSQISWIGSVQLLLVMSMGLVTGRAFDTGYFYPMILTGTLLYAFCLFMLSLTQPEQYYQVFLSQGLGLGIAIGITYLPGLCVVSHYFHRRRALALGIASSGSAVGGVVHPIMLNKLFYGGVGFHQGVRASAALNVGLLAIACLMMRTRLPPKPNRNTSLLRDFLTFSRDAPYVITVFGTMLVICGIYYPIFFLQLNAIKNGISPSLAFYTLAILNGTSVVGRVLPNFLVHRFGVYTVVIPCVVVCAVLNFCTLGIHTAAGTLLFAVLFGFFSGAYIGLFAPMIASLARNDAEMGSRMGICFTFTGIGGLLGTPISGALLTSRFLWWRPIVFAGMCITCGCLCFITTLVLLSRQARERRKLAS
ncbi:hypothetical protein HGRIS_012109 [Hohenbuehelia grisea]